MFPANLQKNIRELDRQISLLEVECDNIEIEKQNLISNPKACFRQLPSKPLLTRLSHSTVDYSRKKSNTCQLPISVISSERSVENKSINNEVPEENHNAAVYQESSVLPKNSDNKIFGANRGKIKLGESPSDSIAREIPKQIVHKEVLIANPGETIEVTVMQKGKLEKDNEPKKSTYGRSIGSIEELSETSEENVRVSRCKTKTKQSSQIRKPKDHSCRQFTVENTQQENSKLLLNSSYTKIVSSDDDCYKKKVKEPNKKKSNRNENSAGTNELSLSADHVPVKKTRQRSIRTRKKLENDIRLDVNMMNPLNEKEIQCTLWKEYQDKLDFQFNVNDSIKTLHFLIWELKKKTTQETEGDIFNEARNKFTQIKDGKSRLNGLVTARKNENNSFSQDETLASFKEKFLGVKQFCEHLEQEKSFLSNELSNKNRTITNMKNQEKEYLSLISTLKYNLERAKEFAHEREKAKKELVAIKAKLQEESKVIEALKRSHGKMQDLIESYALENDRLRTQLKIAKLKSEKYNFLLTGKEVEIKKYKEEMKSFQKQICNQLNMLRSKASENQVESAIKAITNQTEILCNTENESYLSETNEASEQVTETFSKSSTESLSSQTQEENKDVGSSSSFHDVENKEAEAYDDFAFKEDENGNEGGYTSCKSDNSESDKPRSKFRSISNSRSLKSSIEEFLENVKMKRFAKNCPRPGNLSAFDSNNMHLSISTEAA